MIPYLHASCNPAPCRSCRSSAPHGCHQHTVSSPPWRLGSVRTQSGNFPCMRSSPSNTPRGANYNACSSKLTSNSAASVMWDPPWRSSMPVNPRSTPFAASTPAGSKPSLGRFRSRDLVTLDAAPTAFILWIEICNFRPVAFPTNSRSTPFWPPCRGPSRIHRAHRRILGRLHTQTQPGTDPPRCGAGLLPPAQFADCNHLHPGSCRGCHEARGSEADAAAVQGSENQPQENGHRGHSLHQGTLGTHPRGGCGESVPPRSCPGHHPANHPAASPTRRTSSGSGPVWSKARRLSLPKPPSKCTDVTRHGARHTWPSAMASAACKRWSTRPSMSPSSWI